jgi:hypothetical protein
MMDAHGRLARQLGLTVEEMDMFRKYARLIRVSTNRVCRVFGDRRYFLKLEMLRSAGLVEIRYLGRNVPCPADVWLTGKGSGVASELGL